MSPHPEPATPRQLRYLRALAERSGTTFAYPRSAAEASREIQRLGSLRSLTKGERQAERRALYSDRERLAPASSVGPAEISGYGSSCRWSH